MPQESTPKPEEQVPDTATMTPKASLTRTLIARFDQYFDMRTLRIAFRKTNKQVKPKTSKKPVLFVRRIINEKGVYSHTEVDIISIRLQDVFTDINRGVLGFRLAGDPATAEPNLFYYSRKGLSGRLEEEIAKESPDEAFVTDLETSLEFMREYHHDTITELDVLLAHQEIVYDHLWALIEPNTYVYHRLWHTEQDQILLARKFQFQVRYKGREPIPYGLVICDIISNDGDSFGIAQVEIEIKNFRGSKAIQDLEVYPLVFHPEAEALRRHAIARGKKFAGFKEPSYKEVQSGPALTKAQPLTKVTDSEVKEERQKVSVYGRVMIDPVAFRLFEPNTTYNIVVRKGMDRDMLTDEQYMICNPVALGFSFGTKMWGGFALDRLVDVDWSDESFNSLVLGEKQKKLIYALVKQHAARTALYDDVVRDKGRGLIGLLSGKPGCGKTLTAEAVAEVTRRPLYVISAGELGTNPSDVDKKFVRILQLTQKWNAVLLLDEAEVFLQKRNTEDIARNALVSIFLRQLEYYQGILILTTNLAAQCDPALESRIHFCVHYPDLDYNARSVVWRTFLAKGTLDPAKGISDFDLDRLARLELNGRQIKNIVGSAQSIALQYSAPLSVEYVDMVLEVMSEWQKTRNGGG
ncbi:P-loop containing nucleoside triphosphate hydrolase protein [Armillaria gallica]|uniref:P-loop containing nucleoside triphosphate hydrolase protein n=1 Tax=Armillaria gallica TaxID=47427 RepID=A0A2H3DPQ6_ARMGA|nr:P-loop containing nucleoside triphosphate hydrolase protein [Armillaria gallica]